MENEEHIVRYTLAELKEMRARGESLTDWARFDAITDEELEASIDWEEEGEFDLTKAFAGLPPGMRQPSTIQFDGDVLAWFQPRSSSFRGHISGVLRAYVDAQQARAANALPGRQRQASYLAGRESAP